jgi:hypothetical protein
VSILFSKSTSKSYKLALEWLILDLNCFLIKQLTDESVVFEYAIQFVEYHEHSELVLRTIMYKLFWCGLDD